MKPCYTCARYAETVTGYAIHLCPECRTLFQPEPDPVQVPLWEPPTFDHLFPVSE